MLFILIYQILLQSSKYNKNKSEKCGKWLGREIELERIHASSEYVFGKRRLYIKNVHGVTAKRVLNKDP